MRRISTLGIVTADRPKAVERCIDSYIRHLQHHGRSPRILVVDDSRRQANATATREIATTARSTYAGTIDYVGAREKAAARRMLTRAGVEQRTIDFGLPMQGWGFAPGANRNHLLLATAGELLLTADDDTVCDTWRESDDRRIAFAGHADPRHFAFFSNRRQALTAARWDDVDLLSAHEEMLGQSLTAIATRASADNHDDACEHIILGLRSKDASYNVRMTSSGIAGDNAMASPYRLLFSPTTAHHWTALDDRALRRALTSRETLRIAPHATVTHQAATMMYSAGIDNRALLPPFIPIGANEDGLFGVMLRLMAPATFIAHVPVGIVHDSGRASRYDDPRMLRATQTRIADLTIALLRDWHATASARATPRARLQGLGNYLVALSELTIDDFATRVVTASLAIWEHERDRLDEVIAATPGLSPLWRRTLERYREAYLDRASEPRFFIPIELKRSAATSRGFQRMQMYLGELGRLMIAWPEIWSIARREELYCPT
jgi:hypothetical protein